MDSDTSRSSWRDEALAEAHRQLAYLVDVIAKDAERFAAVEALLDHADVIGDYVHVDMLRAALAVHPSP